MEIAEKQVRQLCALTLFSDSYFVISIAGIVFATGVNVATNKWVHKCFERRIKRLERHNNIEEE